MSAAIKAHALFLTAAVAFRFVQRRTIAEFTRFDWVTAPGTSWLTGSAALLTLLVAHGTSRRLRFVGWFRRAVDPPVRALIRDGLLD